MPIRRRCSWLKVTRPWASNSHGTAKALIARESSAAGAYVVAEDLGTTSPEILEALAERGLLSYRLVWFEGYQDVTKAIAREKQLKGWRREKKVALIERSNPALRLLRALDVGLEVEQRLADLVKAARYLPVRDNAVPKRSGPVIYGLDGGPKEVNQLPKR